MPTSACPRGLAHKEAGWEVLDLTDAERGALADYIKANVWPAVEEMVGKKVIDRPRDDK